MIGVMPWCWIAATLRLTISSVSPKISRRSECPAITYTTFSFARNAGEISPVNAPLSSVWQCWAPRWKSKSSLSMTVCTLRRSVNGGWMLMSTSSYTSFGTR